MRKSKPSQRAGATAQVIKCLPSKHEVLGSISSTPPKQTNKQNKTKQTHHYHKKKMLKKPGLRAYWHTRLRNDAAWMIKMRGTNIGTQQYPPACHQNLGACLSNCVPGAPAQYDPTAWHSSLKLPVWIQQALNQLCTSVLSRTAHYANILYKHLQWLSG
jgi:hypothetical protein